MVRRFTVSWPVQGLLVLRSQRSELVLSDVYWMWILKELEESTGVPEAGAFVSLLHSGFDDPANLVESLTLSESFVDAVRAISASRAPAFNGVVPDEDSCVPTAEELLAAFILVCQEAAAEGSLELEVE